MVMAKEKTKRVRAPGRCPRCGGNLFVYNDIDGWYMECLQCSYTRDFELVPAYHPKEDWSRGAKDGSNNSSKSCDGS